MKPHIHHSSIATALAVCALHGAALVQGRAADQAVEVPSRQHREQIERVVPPVPLIQQGENVQIDVKPLHLFPQSNSASSSVTTNSDGTATVTIEVNGKKETRTFKLGNDGGKFSLKLKDGVQLEKTEETGAKETWIGVGVGGPIAPELRAQLPLQSGEGVMVSHVAPGSPAAAAGLAQHDILTRLDDQILVSADQFKKLVKMRKPGETAKLVYLRKGERHEATVTFSEHFAESMTENDRILGFIGDPEKWNLKGLQSEKWQDRVRALREKSGELREKLNYAKENFPGVIVDKQSFILGVDGTVKKIEDGLQHLEGIVGTLREELEKADIPPEKIEEVRRAVEAGIEKAGDAARKAVTDAVREYQIYREFREKRLNEDESKRNQTPSQPELPTPPIKTPQ